MIFTTRAEYKAAVAEWKLEYAALSARIRELRTQFNAAQSAYSKATRTTAEDARHAWQLYNVVEGARCDRSTASSAATAMIAVRHAAKVEAHAQYIKGISRA